MVEGNIASMILAEGSGGALCRVNMLGAIEVLRKRELIRRVACVAEGLKGLGLGRGDRVAVAMEPSMEVVILSFAVWSVGATLIPLATNRNLDLKAELDHLHLDCLCMNLGATDWLFRHEQWFQRRVLIDVSGSGGHNHELHVFAYEELEDGAGAGVNEHESMYLHDTGLLTRDTASKYRHVTHDELMRFAHYFLLGYCCPLSPPEGERLPLVLSRPLHDLGGLGLLFMTLMTGRQLWLVASPCHGMSGIGCPAEQVCP